MPSSVERPLPPMEVRTSEQARATLRTSEHEPDECGTPERLASDLFDEALTAAGLTTQEVAHILGVSESLVQKMRSRDSRGCPSFVQMLRLPPAFHLELHRAMNRRFGFGRAALRRLIETVGDLAVVIE